MRIKNQLLLHQPRPIDRDQENARRIINALYAFTRPSSTQEHHEDRDLASPASGNPIDDDGFRSRMDARCRRYRIGRHLSPDGFTISIELGPGAQDLLMDDQQHALQESIKDLVETQFLIHYLEHLGIRSSSANIAELRNGLFDPKSQGRLRYKFWWKSKGSARDQVQVTYTHNRPESSHPKRSRSQPRAKASQSSPRLGDQDLESGNPLRSGSPWNLVKKIRSTAVSQHRSRLESAFQMYMRSGKRCFANFKATIELLDSLHYGIC